MHTRFFLFREHLVALWSKEAAHGEEVLCSHQRYDVRSVSVVGSCIHEPPTCVALDVALNFTVQITHDDYTIRWF